MAPAARPPCADLVEALELRGAVVVDRLPHGDELVVGQRLVEQGPPCARDDPDARDDDGDRDEQGHRGVEGRGSGDLDEEQRAEHGPRRHRVGAQVRRVALERGGIGKPGLAAQECRDAQVGHQRDRDDHDTEPHVPQRRRLREPVPRLRDDHGGADEDEQALERGRQVLCLLVPVGVRLVGRLVGLADREQRDERREQVDARVHGVGEEGDRTGYPGRHELEHDQRRVRADRQGRGAGLPTVRGQLRGHRAIVRAPVGARMSIPRRCACAATSCRLRELRSRERRRPVACANFVRENGDILSLKRTSFA